MSATGERLRTELMKLSEADRAELAQFLISSLEPEADSDAGKHGRRNSNAAGKKS